MSLDILLGLFAAAVASGVLPFVNAELLIIAAAAASSAVLVPVLVLIVTTGQMASKTLLYALARTAPSWLPEKARLAMDRACMGIRAHGRATGALVLASASIGVPPFYGVSLAAGALRVHAGTFIVVGFIGRALRFGALAWAANEGTRALFGTAWLTLGSLGAGG